MRHQATIGNGVVKVVSLRTGVVYCYPVPPGTVPGGYAMRCAERARVSERLAAIRGRGRSPCPGEVVALARRLTP